MSRSSTPKMNETMEYERINSSRINCSTISLPASQYERINSSTVSGTYPSSNYSKFQYN